MSKTPIRVIRVWCARKCWTSWLPNRAAAYQAARQLDLVYENGAPGPLTWFEYGERQYPRSKTVRVNPHDKGRSVSDWD